MPGSERSLSGAPVCSASAPFGIHAVSNNAEKASFCVVFGPHFAKKLVTPDNIWPVVPWLNFTRRKAWNKALMLIGDYIGLLGQSYKVP